MTGTDRIERELHVRAPIERVWQVVTDPRYVSRWFGDTTDVDLRPGGAAAFGWAGRGRFLAVVERVDPPRAFAFRWSRDFEVPVGSGTSTLVEFSLSPDGDGTRLRLVESGFVDPAHRRENDEGWTEELGQLLKLLEAGER